MSGRSGPRFRLYRSESDRYVSGVAGGLAEILEIDSTLVRLLWVLVALVTSGVGLFAYLIMWAIVPERSKLPAGSVSEPERGDAAPESADSGPESSAATEADTAASRPSNGPVIAGVVLIVIGTLFLLDNWVPLNFWTYVWDLVGLALQFWPLFLVAAGVLLVYSRLRR